MFKKFKYPHYQKYRFVQNAIIPKSFDYLIIKSNVICMHFYRSRVRSFATLVTSSLTSSLTHSVVFSRLDWCDPGVCRCQLKTCWGYYFCCWYLVEVTKLNPGQYSEARFGQDFNFRFCRDADVWLRFWS